MAEKVASCKIFYSYAPEDKLFCDELDKHLATLKRLELISVWNSRDIQAGTEWLQEVHHQLDAADIILVLVSADFLSSEYYTSVEMKRALERHKAGTARVIPILLRPVEWEGLPLTQLSTLPPGGMPVTSWQDQHQAFATIARELRKVILDLQASLEVLQTSQKEGATFQAASTAEVQVKSLNNISEETPSGPPTINTHNAVALFRTMMAGKSTLRILSLVGDGKMGKTHLLTKVFPALAKNCQAKYTNIDLLYLKRIPDILHQASFHLGAERFPRYNKAYQEWMNTVQEPKKESSWIQRLLSLFRGSRSDLFTSSYERDMYFTNLFIEEIKDRTETPIVLFFDTINAASEGIQDWLIHILLVRLLSFSRIYVVIAGRSLPAFDGIYTLQHEQYMLKPIVDIDEYITYCQICGVDLDEVTIKNFAFGFDYVPGMFTDFVYPKFVRAS